MSRRSDLGDGTGQGVLQAIDEWKALKSTLHPLTVVWLVLERLLKSEAKLAMLLMDYAQAFISPGWCGASSQHGGFI